MTEKEILTNNLLGPGTMFKVTDKVKDSALPPGSLGFTCFVRKIDDSYQNLAIVSAIMIRKGKGGKDRIMTTTMAVPIFYVDHKGFNKLMPEDGTKKGYVHIEPAAPPAVNIMSLTPLEFLGFGVALSIRIKFMADQCRHKKWPEVKSHPVRAMLRVADHFEGDPEKYLTTHAADEFRETFIKEAQRMTYSLVRMQIQLDKEHADTIVNAAEFLVFTNSGEFIPKESKEKENEYKFTEDDAMLKRTLTFHKKICSDMNTLYKNKKTKPKS